MDALICQNFVKNIMSFTLRQITFTLIKNVFPGQHPYWYTADDINIAIDWKVLWEEFTSNLEGARIRINSCSDRLVWDYNHVDGSITANLIYDSIVYASSPPIGCPLLALVWSGIMPLKISCFIWLTLENKILTWNNLQKRGWIGPR